MKAIQTKANSGSTAKVQSLYLSNCHNCIQAALFQLSLGNTAAAVSFLKTAQGSLQKARAQ